ncbi:MAG: hypothetical protein NVSMB2_05510 [Chloroflexota bacterium]
MFGFLRRGPSPAASDAIRQALFQHGLPTGTTVNSLRVLTRQGNYSGRSVRFFSAFDEEQARHSGVVVRSFDDLEAHPRLVIGSGHVEHNGVVTLTHYESSATAPAPARAQADRGGHTDDAHLVFPGSHTPDGSAAHPLEPTPSKEH